MNQRIRSLACFVAVAMLAVASDGRTAFAGHKHHHAKKADSAKSGHKRHSARKKSRHDAVARHKSEPPAISAPAVTPVIASLTPELAAVKQAIDLVRRSKIDEATAVKQTTDDAVARKFIEWFILRHPNSEASFNRYAAFISDNQSWPSIRLLRRRAEMRLWQEQTNPATVLRFIDARPASGLGRFALARALLTSGDREAAAREVRAAWRSDELSEISETHAADVFHDLLTPEDHRARMDKRIGAKDFSGAMRAARRLGSNDVSIVKACAATMASTTKSRELLDDVPTEARQDLGYVLCRIHWLSHHDRFADATRLMLSAQSEGMALQDTDEWWRERRVLARKLLDLGEFDNAYQVVRNAAVPANENYRAEFHFVPGWIALRYLNDPDTARKHFAHIDEGSTNPIVIARANYWRGRAGEALGDADGMHACYEAAARHPTAYYGQLARAKLGAAKIELRTALENGPSGHNETAKELVHVVEMLYALGERDLVLTFAKDLAEESSDRATLAALAESTERHGDAPAMLQIGKTALARGLALDLYAFPAIGVPPHKQFGPEVERSVIYSVARTESAFDQRDTSPAKAVGLMQVTPEAGRDTAKRFGVTYDWNRLVSDPVYNTQMGAAELGALLREYGGSHVMSFAAYNAGRGRVQQWIKQHGDPRDPKVDAVDWVERIPFAETRNYVQRVMENLQVYRTRFESVIPMVSKLYEQRAPAQDPTSTSISLRSNASGAE